MSGPFPTGLFVDAPDLNAVLLGWVDFVWFGSTLAYVSADAPTFVFSVNADMTGVIDPGMRVRLTQTTDKFFIVTAVGAYAAGVTPITVYGGTDYTLANAAITAGAFSTHKKPWGFNASPLKWSQELNDTADHIQSSPGAGTWYNPGGSSLLVPIGAWMLRYDAVADITSGPDGYATLSTTNNGQSDADLAFRYTGTNTYSPLGREKFVLLAAKTTYYLNAKANSGGAGQIGFLGSVGTTIIRAVCAYL